MTTVQEQPVTAPDVVAEALAKIKVPRWAKVVADWESEGGETAFHRQINGPVHEADECHVLDAEPFTAHVYCSMYQSSDGSPAEASVELTLEHAWANMTPASARSLAEALLAVADEVEGPRPGSGGEPQQLIARAIQARIKALPIGQNEFAVGAGYGTSDFSQLMTGAQVMDTRDIEIIAKALGMEPIALIAEAVEL